MWYTGTGDAGDTGLLGPERVAKDSPRIEALGELDEAMAAIGVARAQLRRPESRPLLLSAQRGLSLLMAEVACPRPEALARRIDADAVAGVEAAIAALSAHVARQTTFILPGDTPGGAALDLARAVVRRAERRVVHLRRQQLTTNLHLLHYLNRLSSLLYLLARADDAIGLANEQPA
jgi:cob(I)alamin adenosyltransferase